MHYIKLGPVKIPYQVTTTGTQKTLHLGGLKIPFASYVKDGHKYYRIFGLSLRFPVSDKVFITQGRANYLMKDQLDDAKIRDLACQIFKERLGYELDLDDPRSMNEKIFWLKLNYHDPLVTRCCDKFAVKDYVTETLGPGYVIPTLKSWDSAEAMDLTGLPDRYVLKVNWSSGYNIIVRDAAALDQAETRKKVAHWMEPGQNSYYQTFNWGYKDMKPVVYAEQYMEQMDGQLYDYKFFCSSGKAKFFFIATDRADKLTHDFYDMDFNKLEFDYGGRYHSSLPLQKPRFFAEMVRCAEQLARPFPFVRVDFYETDNAFYVGEMTFYPGGGILPFTPREWDYKLGAQIDLTAAMEPKKREE